MRLLLIVVLTLLVTRTSRAECPANTLGALSYTLTTFAPRDTAYRDTSGCVSHPSHCWSQTGRAVYDLVAGTIHVYVQGTNRTASASVFTHDVFTLLGPPSSPPITFTAQARVGLDIGCNGVAPSASASIREGASNVVEAANQECDDVATDIGIGITRQTGGTFDLYMTAAAQAGEFFSGGFVYASVRLSFPDLPAGYSVVSCQGYSSAPVATRQGSWGALKTLYR